LPVTTVQTVQQRAAAGIGQGPENVVVTHADIMQPNGCLSRREKGLCLGHSPWVRSAVMESVELVAVEIAEVRRIEAAAAVSRSAFVRAAE
jgi:hypothetical protein